MNKYDRLIGNRIDDVIFAIFPKIDIWLFGRRDWDNMTSDPDEGNYWEFLNAWKRFKMGAWSDFSHNFKRAFKYRSLLEFRWIRYRWYKKNKEEIETVKMTRQEAVELIDLLMETKNFLHCVQLQFMQATPHMAGELRYKIEKWMRDAT